MQQAQLLHHQQWYKSTDDISEQPQRPNDCTALTKLEKAMAL